MKWPSLDESVSLCICLLTIACNREMQPFFYWLFVVGGGNISGSAFKLNCAARVGSEDLGHGLGSGFIFKPVQTSRRAVSYPLPEPPALLQKPHCYPFETF